MTFLIPTHEQAHAGLRAMKTVLTAAGPLAPIRREALGAIQSHLLRTAVDLDALGPITPEELAAAIDDPALRTQLISGMVTLTLVRDTVADEEQAAIERFAAGLAVEPVTLAQLRKFQTERLMALRVDVIRRSLAGPGIKQLYEDQGFLGVVKNFGSFAGLWENSAVAERYRALENYPEGSLGKELWRFYRANDFKFPGEKHGAPEALLAHDLSHILGGYAADFQSEGLVLAFQAGYKRQDAFSVLVFLLLNGQHGLRLTAFAAPARGFYNDRPGAIDDVVRAFARGSRVKLDFTDHWDFWPVMERQVEELRREYGIEPA
ncbi:hypothetical protein [Nannocystis punicea]|uniref:Uncharacterized protein n=1 Tax=Nannocystis punicea TaxID=2995304 RepID=A0ABY7GVK7_9BACT|nr:hypothetical protein [Nannocystis poenicansa]WAS90976.1 hypothetical protein O0S08_32710 [Nannocystis poenicansa]